LKTHPSGVALFLASLLVSLPAYAEGPFVGQFELKTLESAPGYLEFQSQNAYSFGQPSRAIVADDDDEDELVYDHNSVIRQRHALEMEFGFTRYLKSRIGIEFENERLEEPGSPLAADDFTGTKLTEIGGELIAILVPRDGDGVGLGAVVEVEHPIYSAKGEPNSILMGPILEWASGAWTARAVPAVVRSFGGRREEPEEGEPPVPLDHDWDFSYAAELGYTFSETWTLKVEGYGTVDRLGDSGHRGEAARRFGDFDLHRLGPVLYWSVPLAPETGEEEGSELSIGLGLLAGLNDNTPDSTLKLSAEVDF